MHVYWPPLLASMMQFTLPFSNTTLDLGTARLGTWCGIMNSNVYRDTSLEWTINVHARDRAAEIRTGDTELIETWLTH